MLFAVDEGLPCPVGTNFLRKFTEAPPAHLASLEPSDHDWDNSAFEVTSGWNAFAQQSTECELCNA